MKVREALMELWEKNFFEKERTLIEIKAVLHKKYGLNPQNPTDIINKCTIGKKAFLNKNKKQNKNFWIQKKRISYISDKLKKEEFFWKDMHPVILKIAKDRYESGHYADSVEYSLKEINNIVKELYKSKTDVELDGVDLMRNAFGIKKDKSITLEIDDGSPNDTEKKNIQEGYMNLFAGSIVGIRNPKAHRNIVIDAITARHHLYLASLLLYNIDKIKK